MNFTTGKVGLREERIVRVKASCISYIPGNVSTTIRFDRETFIYWNKNRFLENLRNI